MTNAGDLESAHLWKRQQQIAVYRQLIRLSKIESKEVVDANGNERTLMRSLLRLLRTGANEERKQTARQ